LAANLTQLVVILAPSPKPSGFLLDQYLVAAEIMGVKAAVVCNKMDLLAASERSVFVRRFAPYRSIGYPVLPISLRGDIDLGDLNGQLEGEISILVGQSGVGKSSLIKVLLPDQEIQIGRLSKATGLGRHTTVTATSYRLPAGGCLLDSPGVRSFRLGAICTDDLQRGFRELAPLVGHCRFANCRHRREPGCAVKQAVREGLIDPERMNSFLHLASSLEDSSKFSR
jgi:ribosome biogenesis GTPase